MIKVLQIIDGKSFGGIVKLMLDIEKIISKDIKLDFLTSINIIDKWNSLNISRKNLKGKIIYNYRLYKYLKNNKYDIVHINSGAFFFTFQVIIICKLLKVKKIIVHSHNTPKINIFKRALIKVINPIYRNMIDVKIACSKEAAKSLFTKIDDVFILKNGINVDKFRFNKKIRDEYRKKLNIGNSLVYGHVGRFDKQKNHEFLINLFYEIQKKQNNALLLLIGSGQLEQQIKDKVYELNIENKVIFLGFREDVNQLLNCIDIFVFPSLYEGLGVSLIEAQTCGLPVVASKNIPDEAIIFNNFSKIQSFNENDWLEHLLALTTWNREKSYLNTINKGFDIKDTCNSLEQIYKKLL